jgi:hypothetical protein
VSGTRDPEAKAVIKNILELDLSAHRRRGREAIFRPEQQKTRLLWRRRKRPAPPVMTGWRIGCYYRQGSQTLPGGTRIKREVSHPVYLLSDGRLVVGAFRTVDAEGTVRELPLPRKGRPPWFTPLEDSHAFFGVQPGHYLDELNALYADLT